MKLAPIALITLLLLTGCFQATFDKDQRAATSPIVRQYSREEQARAARELQAQKCDPRLNDVRECTIPQLVEMMKDYWVMRREARAITQK